MHPNARLLRTFYAAFQNLDSSIMGACYRDDATFSDPAFPELSAKETCGMWEMLCSGAKDLKVSFEIVDADDLQGLVRWEARYLFSKTGRPVHNQVRAAFRFKDGKILTHTDHFNFWRWSSQALGPVGLLLGWNQAFQRKFQSIARMQLDRFLARV